MEESVRPLLSRTEINYERRLALIFAKRVVPHSH